MKLRESKSHRVLAPAKINIRLEILSKREDGYHEIRTIMCGVGLYDVVFLSKGEAGIKTTSNSSQIPLDSNNLANKAAYSFINKAKIFGGLDIHLEKHIPVAAGLGGGSSDAAAVMKGLNELYALEYSQPELIRLGAEIGADVPFFFSAGPVLATGKGEKLSSVDLSPPFLVLLVTPRLTVSTAWAYSRFKGRSGDKLIDFAKKIDLLKVGQEIFYNDLESVVIPAYPEIAAIKEILIKLGSWGSLMSGSGPTVFGVFFDETAAKRAEKKLLKDYGSRNWRVAVAKALL